MFCMKKNADALIDARSKTTMTIAPMEQAAMATAAIIFPLSASVGTGPGSFSSATTITHTQVSTISVIIRIVVDRFY